LTGDARHLPLQDRSVNLTMGNPRWSRACCSALLFRVDCNRCCCSVLKPGYQVR
jgi:hypothetical protein